MANNRKLDELTEKYYTVKEVAELLKVTERTVRNWIRKGQIKAIKIGRVWRIPANQFSQK